MIIQLEKTNDLQYMLRDELHYRLAAKPRETTKAKKKA